MIKKNASFKLLIIALAIITGIYALAFFYGNSYITKIIKNKQSKILDPQSIAQTCFFTSSQGIPCFKVQIADTDKKREKGLMFVKELPENEGMLFVYDQEGIYSFWMKNTLIPLDMIWIDKDKKIVDIQTAQPCTSAPCPSYIPAGKAKYILEINAGLSEKYGLKYKDIFLTANFSDIYCPEKEKNCKIEKYSKQSDDINKNSEIIRSYYTNGEIYKEIQQENKNTKETRRYLDGKIMDEIVYENISSKLKEYRTYYKNGNKKVREKNNKNTSIQEERYENGNPKLKVHKKNGRVTQSISYYENGKKSGLSSFDSATTPQQKHGEQKTRYKNGELQYEDVRKNGKKHGIEKLYTQEGTPNYEKNWNNGEPTGTRKKRDKYGKLIFESNYKNR